MHGGNSVGCDTFSIGGYRTLTKIFLTTLFSAGTYATYVGFVRFVESLAERLPESRVKRLLLRRI
jgi:hypothetical protein